MHVTEHLRDIDHRNRIRSRAAHVQLRLVRRDRRRIGHGEVAVKLIDRYLHDSADVVAEQRQRIAECPSMLDVRQRYQVLGTKLRRYAKLAVSRECNMK